MNEATQEYRLDSEYKKLVECLGFEMTTVNALVQRFGWMIGSNISEISLT